MKKIFILYISVLIGLVSYTQEAQTFVMNIHDNDTVKTWEFDYDIPFTLQIKENILSDTTKNGELNIQVTTKQSNEYLDLINDSIPYTVNKSKGFLFYHSIPRKWKAVYTKNLADSGYVILTIEPLTPKFLNKP